MVRSVAERRVSNQGPAAPSFETAAAQPHQDEGGDRSAARGYPAGFFATLKSALLPQSRHT